MKKELSPKQIERLLNTLKVRFDENMVRHKGIDWADVLKKLTQNPNKLWSLYQMEDTGGEPDVVDFNKKNNEYIFYDCSSETPKGRRSICYDKEALESRKKFKPDNNVLDMAADIGIKILNEEQYRKLQELGNFDSKTSSWIETPCEIRKLGGALFADFRFNHVFIYHNGADSYYASRGFRGFLNI